MQGGADFDFMPTGCSQECYYASATQQEEMEGIFRPPVGYDDVEPLEQLRRVQRRLLQEEISQEDDGEFGVIYEIEDPVPIPHSFQVEDLTLTQEPVVEPVVLTQEPGVVDLLTPLRTQPMTQVEVPTQVLTQTYSQAYGEDTGISAAAHWIPAPTPATQAQEMYVPKYGTVDLSFLTDSDDEIPRPPITVPPAPRKREKKRPIRDVNVIFYNI